MKAKATKMAMATATRLASKNKGDCDGNEGGGKVIGPRAMAVTMPEVGKDEGNGDSNEGG